MPQRLLSPTDPGCTEEGMPLEEGEMKSQFQKIHTLSWQEQALQLPLEADLED